MQTMTLPAHAQPAHDSAPDGLIGHEARHAALAVFFQFGVKNIRTDWPEPNIPGRVEFDHADETWDEMRLAEMFITIAGGSMNEKGLDWPPAWPPSLTHPDSDEYALARICQLLNLDERKYLALTGIARETVEHPAIRAAENALSTMLEYGNLTGKMARDLAEAAMSTYFEELREREERKALEADPRYRQVRQKAHDDVLYAMKDDEARWLRAECRRIAAEFG
jgi:hypothetical protein